MSPPPQNYSAPSRATAFFFARSATSHPPPSFATNFLSSGGAPGQLGPLALAPCWRHPKVRGHRGNVPLWPACCHCREAPPREIFAARLESASHWPARAIRGRSDRHWGRCWRGSAGSELRSRLVGRRCRGSESRGAGRAVWSNPPLSYGTPAPSRSAAGPRVTVDRRCRCTVVLLRPSAAAIERSLSPRALSSRQAVASWLSAR